MRRHTRPARGPGSSFLMQAGASLLMLGAMNACTIEDRPRTLGPADGHDLSATDLERVGPGVEAPDFSLVALGGDTVSLSDYRGVTPVVLVFYRGHW